MALASGHIPVTGGERSLDSLGFGLIAMAALALGFARPLAVVVRSVPIALAIEIVWSGPIEHLVQNVWAGAGRWFPGLLLEAFAGGGSTEVGRGSGDRDGRGLRGGGCGRGADRVRAS